MDILSLTPALASLEHATLSGTWVMHLGETPSVWWSPGTRRLLEWPAEGAPPALDGAVKVYTDASRPLVMQALVAARDHGTAFDMEAELVTTTGRPLFVRVTGEAERDNDRIIRVAGTIQNIDRSRRAEAHAQMLRERLAELEERWRLATEGSGLGVWDCDMQAETVYFSPQWKQMLGYTEDEVGNTLDEWDSRLHPDDRDACWADLNAHLEGRSDRYINEHRVRCKDGSYKWILDRGKVMSRTADGKPLRVVGTHTDISRRKFLEDVANQVNARYQAIFNSTYQYIGLLSPDGILLEVNDTALGFAALNAAQVIGKAFWECHWFDLDDATRASVKRAIHRAAQGEFVRQQMDIRGAESMTHIIDFSVKPVRDERNEIAYLVAEGHDVTARVFAERAMGVKDRLFRTAFDDAPIGTAIVGLDGRWIEVNDALSEMLGYDNEVLKGMTFQDITHPDDLDTDVAHVERLLAGEAPHYRMEKRYLCADARVIQCQLDVSLVRDDQGRPQCFLSQIQDLTDQRHAESALEEEKELAQVTLASISDGVVRTDLLGQITFVNDTALRLLKAVEQEVLGRPFDQVFQLVSERDGGAIDSPVQRVLRDGMPTEFSSLTTLCLRDQSQVPIEEACSPVRDLHGQLIGAVFVFSDVSATRKLVLQLAHQANHDALTGLPNRRSFVTELDAVRRVAQTRQGEHYLLLLDLDYFKRINDQCGHLVGDQVLRDVSGRMRARLRQADLFARLGGDEYGLILRDCPLQQVARIAEGLIRAVATLRVSVAGCDYQLGVSMGVAAIDGTLDTSQLLSRADQACYEAKAFGRGRAVIDGEMLTGNRAALPPERRTVAAAN